MPIFAIGRAPRTRDMSRGGAMPALDAERVSVAAEGGRADILAGILAGNGGRNPSASFIGFAVADACFGADARAAALLTGRRGIPGDGCRTQR